MEEVKGSRTHASKYFKILMKRQNKTSFAIADNLEMFFNNTNFYITWVTAILSECFHI